MAEVVHLLLKKDVRLEVPTVAPMVAEAMGINIFDARRIARYARGLFVEETDRERAGKLSAALAGKGIQTLLVAAEDYQQLPEARRIVTAEPLAEGLAYKIDYRRPFETIPWQRLSFISAGVVATPQYRGLLSSKQFKLLPAIHKVADQEAKKDLREKLASLSLKKKKSSGGTAIRHRTRIKEEDLQILYKEQTFGYMDLVTLHPFDRLRINRHEFRFDYLKERAGANSLENFKLMCRDLVGLAKDSLISNMTMALVDGVEVHELIFDSLAEFDRYNTWFLYMGLHTADTLGRAPQTIPEKDFTQASVELKSERRGTSLQRRVPETQPTDAPAVEATPQPVSAPPPGADANPPAAP